MLGSFTIGENSKIGAGSVVLSAVPPNSTVVGVPGRVVCRNCKPPQPPRETLDQIHLPDPVREDIAHWTRYICPTRCARISQICKNQTAS